KAIKKEQKKVEEKYVWAIVCGLRRKVHSVLDLMRRGEQVLRLQCSVSNARFIRIIGWDAFGLPSEQYAIEVMENMLGQGCLDWNTEVLYGFKRQQSKKGKGGRNHHQELIPESIGRMKMKGALVSSRNAIWPVDEEE
ncbi:hypothetical protein Tco_1365153, partial [Tanacetum coccineum]